MKKLLVALLVIGLIVAVNVQSASANNGPHGGYADATDACAGCHRAHSSQNNNLLDYTTTQLLCYSCHGSAATGADTDVEDGEYKNDDATAEAPAEGVANDPLLGGGFALAYDAQVAPGFKAITSNHDTATGTNLAAWALNAVTGATSDAVALTGVGTGLTCDDCHDPHGSGNYRIIRETVNGVAGVVVTDSAATNYTAEAYADNTIGDLCVSCHANYSQTGAGSGDAAIHAHRTDGDWDGEAGVTDADILAGFVGNVNPENGAVTWQLRLSDAGGADMGMNCSTCHYAHGTAAAMSAVSQGAAQNNSSSLLVYDDRTVCQSCHQK